MLEIFRCVMTGCDENQRLVVGGAEQVPRRDLAPPGARLAYWPAGTSLASLHSGAPRPGVAQIARDGDGRLTVTDAWGDTRRYAAVLVTCQSWLLTTQIECVTCRARAAPGASRAKSNSIRSPLDTATTN